MLSSMRPRAEASLFFFFFLGGGGVMSQSTLTNLDFPDYKPTQDRFVTAKRILDTAR
jgi:hypothetical protein